MGDVIAGALDRSPGGLDADGGVGVQYVADLLVQALDGVEGLLVANALRLEVAARALEHVLVDGAETALLLEILEP